MILTKVFTKVRDLKTVLEFGEVSFGKAYAKLIEINAMIFKINASNVRINKIEFYCINERLRNIKDHLKTLEPKAGVDVIYLKSFDYLPPLTMEDQNDLLYDPMLD